MTTEIELRHAMSSRADDCQTRLDEAEAAIATTLLRARRVPAPRRRRTALAGLAVAATVAAVGVIPLAIAGRHDTPAAPAPVTSSRPAAPVGTITSPTPRTQPTTTPPLRSVTTPATPASTPAAPPAVPSPGAVTAVALTHLVSVGIDRSILWDLRPDAEYVTVQLPGDKHASITAFPPAAGFSADRISKAQPVTVAGTPGWYGNISVWPVNGRPDPTSGKQDGAVPSVAWQIGTTWVVVQSDDSSVVGPTKVAALAATLDITDQPEPLRLPFTVGYLPQDFAVTSYGFFAHAPGDPSRPSWAVSLQAGSTSLDISLTATANTVEVDPPAGVQQVSRPGPAGFVLQATGTKLSKAQLQQVLQRTTVESDPAGPSIGWPLLRSALP